jgi:hypothetical protein
MMMIATVDRYHLANKGFIEPFFDIVRKCDHSSNTSQHSLSGQILPFRAPMRVDKHLIAWQTMDTPKNTLVSQRLCEMQCLASVVIATIRSKIQQSYAIKLLG